MTRSFAGMEEGDSSSWFARDCPSFDAEKSYHIPQGNLSVPGKLRRLVALYGNSIPISGHSPWSPALSCWHPLFSTFCLYGFACSGLFIQTGSYNVWSVVSGLFHLPGFQGSFMLWHESVPHFLSELSNIPWHVGGIVSTF